MLQKIYFQIPDSKGTQDFIFESLFKLGYDSGVISAEGEVSLPSLAKFLYLMSDGRKICFMTRDWNDGTYQKLEIGELIDIIKKELRSKGIAINRADTKNNYKLLERDSSGRFQKLYNKIGCFYYPSSENPEVYEERRVRIEMNNSQYLFGTDLYKDAPRRFLKRRMKEFRIKRIKIN